MFSIAGHDTSASHLETDVKQISSSSGYLSNHLHGKQLLTEVKARSPPEHVLYFLHL